MKKYGKIALTLVAVMLFAVLFAACAPTGSIEDGFLESIDITSHEESIEESEEEPSTAEGQAHPPKVVDVVSVTPQTVIIAGHCDEGCSVTITDGDTDVTVESIEGYFITQYTINSTTFSVLSATAVSDKLKESEITSIRVDYNSTAMKRIDGLGVTVGSGSHLYYDYDLACYTGVVNELDGSTSSTLLTQTELKNFKNRINTYITNFRKRADSDDVEIIYVLIPNAVSTNPSILAEGTTQENYKTRYEQVVEAIQETNAIAIDMSEVFAEEAAKGSKIYYNTDSHLTEYGGYLVYKAICDYISVDFPDAKARDLATEFTATETDLISGNLVRHLGLTRTEYTEKSTKYTPKFSLKIGAEDDKIAAGSGKISDFNKYSDENSMLLDTDATKSLASRMLFGTNRKNLPCALIYRDDSALTFSDILAERFNRVLLGKLNDFAINLTDTQRYYGYNAKTGTDNKTVDYIIMILSEANLDMITG